MQTTNPREPIYLDHAATTAVRPEVREAMDPYLSSVFGNPSSTHRWGREAASALDRARRIVAEVLGAEPPEIRFIRGGTEGDNLAVLGRAEAVLAAGVERPLVGLSAVEHSAVRDLEAPLEALGCRVRRIGVGPDGALDTEALDEVLEEGAALLSVMWVNNEVGTLFPVPEIAARAAATGTTFHTDAVQALGKVPVDLGAAPAHLAVITGHKICGPKGTGALFIRRGTELASRIFGGGQEGGLRPGTQDVAGAVGLAEAVRLAAEEREEEGRRLGTLRDRLEKGLTERIPGLRVHGGAGERAPHVSNVGISEVDSRALLPALDMEGLAVSGGSACSSGSVRTSPVLRAMYGEDASTHAPVRYSLGRTTREAEIDRAIEITTRVVERLRST